MPAEQYGPLRPLLSTMHMCDLWQMSDHQLRARRLYRAFDEWLGFTAPDLLDKEQVGWVDQSTGRTVLCASPVNACCQARSRGDICEMI